MRVLRNIQYVTRTTPLTRLAGVMSLRKVWDQQRMMSGDAAASIQKLMCPISDVPCNDNKITVVGAGQVGMAVAFALLTQKVCTEICIFDAAKEKLEGEMMDLQHGVSFLKNSKVCVADGYSCTENSCICVITAGARQKQGESRLQLVQRNADIMKEMVPKLVEKSPETILLLVTNPVDIMSYVAWKVSSLPLHCVMGTGTHLDSARFRYFIGKRMCVAPTSCHGYVIGEHGDSSVPIWSSTNIGGVRLAELNPDIGTDNDEEKWKCVHEDVVKAGMEVIKRKGYTSWAIGLTTADICDAILRNSGRVACVSTLATGYHGIDKEIFLSLPCRLHKKGITAVIQQKLSEIETQLLQKSANTLGEVQASVTL